VKHWRDVASVHEVNLAPGLLVSMPHLHDPFFARSVVLMVEHSDDGSFGLVLNQPSDLPVTQLLEALELEWAGDPEQMVWSGGPVMPTSGWVLHAPIDGMPTTDASLEVALEAGVTVVIAEDLCLSTSSDSLKTIAGSPPDRSRIFLGYAGWGPNQLAHEMARGSWLHADVTAELVFDTPAEEMWKRSLESIGVDPEAIVQTRGVH
jgi:putative transcriptional regulator